MRGGSSLRLCRASERNQPKRVRTISEKSAPLNCRYLTVLNARRSAAAACSAGMPRPWSHSYVARTVMDRNATGRCVRQALHLIGPIAVSVPMEPLGDGAPGQIAATSRPARPSGRCDVAVLGVVVLFVRNGALRRKNVLRDNRLQFAALCLAPVCASH